MILPILSAFSTNTSASVQRPVARTSSQLPSSLVRQQQALPQGLDLYRLARISAEILTSQSCLNSTPPAASNIESALLRTKTKNQLKKERQEHAKALEEEAKTKEVVKPSVEEPAQEEMVSRKKITEN
ncbi:hypothetical protein M409DRAFT_29512 [Zasmidium cellare ATCC 36951]|uniref:Uncharacterized protein n=1 Tax=Zasmidium cellare ATCC 36951 TaxID=1080233 RepID=A0A6A6BZ41_ZASCE|nr:uncharacterized protein M409DRAFT_29512 [Zasmidium cellare ATCC 36951]KAF2160064.1 hypothetical protein M409DRAFT_29512 [Zasmidium cellare ATCC 36951]